MHTEASKRHRDSVEALEAKEKQNLYSLMQPPAASMEADVMEIPFKTYVNTKDFVKMAHFAKRSIGFWIAASMESGSDGKPFKDLKNINV